MLGGLLGNCLIFGKWFDRWLGGVFVVEGWLLFGLLFGFWEWENWFMFIVGFIFVVVVVVFYVFIFVFELF